MISARIPRMKSGLLKKLVFVIASEGFSVFEAVLVLNRLFLNVNFQGVDTSI